MKNAGLVLASLVLALVLVLEFRYALVVNSPIVAKIDRITGDVWIANSGVWLKVHHTAKEKAVAQNTASQKAADKTAQAKTK